MATKNLYKAKGGVQMVSGKKGNQVQSFDNPSDMNRDRIDYFAQMGIETIDDTMEFSMMKKGGSVKKKKKKQGYNSRLDESLGMRNKGKKKQSFKSRRDESKGMKKSKGKKAYSANRSSAQGRRKK
tara:strand:+ start:44 stop:421 length:378 start_codon:yes stop_codon:yes gene_type:complete